MDYIIWTCRPMIKHMKRVVFRNEIEKAGKMWFYHNEQFIRFIAYPYIDRICFVEYRLSPGLIPFDVS